MKKTASQIANEVLTKVGFSVSDEGHEYDANLAELKRQQALEMARMMAEENVVGYRDPETGKNPVEILKALRYNLSTDSGEGHPIAEAREQQYIRDKHRKGQNAYNPFGGMFTPNPEEEGHTPGFFGSMGKVGPKQDSPPQEAKTASQIADVVLTKRAITLKRV